MGWEKVACWSTNVPISLKHVKIDEKLLWRAYRKSLTFFRLFGSRHRDVIDDVIKPFSRYLHLNITRSRL